MKDKFHRIAREPLLHFLVMGALLFVAYSWVSRGKRDESKPRQVHIAENDVQWLRNNWSRQWQREPTRDELSHLITEFLREELLANEARTLGLEENDTFIRRWLAQKMQFLVSDTALLAEPSEEDLHRFYKANSTRFAEPPRISFTHIFFSSEHRKDARADAVAALPKLQESPIASQDPAPSGDSFLLDLRIGDADEQTVASQFGAAFADKLFQLQPGAWRGPIQSAYGQHLVRVSSLIPGALRPFAEVKAQVLERWREQRQHDENEKYYAGLLKKYDVVVDEKVKPLIGALGSAISEPVYSIEQGAGR